MGRVKNALFKAGVDKEYVDDFQVKACQGIMLICFVQRGFTCM
jgi:hypothetical protein